MFGMKVEKFCFGLPFGPILYEKKIGDVTYGIHWLFFLGGYVAFRSYQKQKWICMAMGIIACVLGVVFGAMAYAALRENMNVNMNNLSCQ